MQKSEMIQTPLPLPATIPKADAGATVPSECVTLYELLRTGKENAVTQAQLSQALCVDDRTIRFRVHKLRASGFHVASGDCGYYFVADGAELKEYLDRVNHRQKTTALGAATFRRMVKERERSDL